MSVVPSRHTAVGILNKNHKLASFQVETPTPGPTDVLVKPTYTSHTPISLWQVDFAYLCDDIKIISGNIVGQVVAKGDEVKSVSIGEMVRTKTLILRSAKYTPRSWASRSGVLSARRCRNTS